MYQYLHIRTAKYRRKTFHVEKLFYPNFNFTLSGVLIRDKKPRADYQTWILQFYTKLTCKRIRSTKAIN